MLALWLLQGECTLQILQSDKFCQTCNRLLHLAAWTVTVGVGKSRGEKNHLESAEGEEQWMEVFIESLQTTHLSSLCTALMVRGGSNPRDGGGGGGGFTCMEMCGVSYWEAMPFSDKEARVASNALGSPGLQGVNTSLPFSISFLQDQSLRMSETRPWEKAQLLEWESNSTGTHAR